MAPDNRKKLPLKRALEPRRQQSNTADDTPRGGSGRARPSSEQRSKLRNDSWHAENRGRANKNARSPAPKKQRARVTQQELEEEDLTVTEVSLEGSGANIDVSDSSDHSSGDDMDDTEILEKEPTPLMRPKSHVKKENKRKHFVEVDKRGHPHGKITSYLVHDVKAFAKGLNPCFGWSDQPLHEKQRFYDRLYADWEVGGDQTEINPGWFPHIVTKTLINVRHSLMKLIDAGHPKPPEVDENVWKTLVARRSSQKSKVKSEQMRAISKGKASKDAQMRAIEKTMIGELTLRLGRIPVDDEVQEATEREYARRQAEAQKPPMDYGEEIGDLRATTSEIGGRLGRMERMIRQLIRSLEDNNGKQQTFSGVAGVEEFVGGDDDDGLDEDKEVEENQNPDIVPDTEVDVDEVADVPIDAVADAKADVNCYLVDNEPDGTENNNAVVDVTSNLQPKALDTSVQIAPTPAAKDVQKDVQKDVRESTPALTDPYSLGVHEAPPIPEQTLIPSVQEASRQEVANLPSSASSSRSNRVTRNVPSAKPTKFAPPKVAKASTVKGGKGSPVKPADQPKKGDASRRK